MYIKTILLLLINSVVITQEQRDNTRSILFHSILIDDGIFCNWSKGYDDASKCMEDFYKNIKIETGSEIRGEFEKKEDHTFYSLQVYKVASYTEKNTYLIIKYKDTHSEAWYRIKGYQKNDFIHLYQLVLRRYYNRKKSLDIIEEWQSQDSLLLEVDFKCLIDGINRKKTKSNCFISESLKFRKSLYIAPKNSKTDQLYDDIYATFSRRPYSGTLPEY